MQTQTRKFISLGDFVSFRFRCKTKGCGTELSLPLQENYTLTHPAAKCPNCNAALRFSKLHLEVFTRIFVAMAALSA
jgi:hypothetical protein